MYKVQISVDLVNAIKEALEMENIYGPIIKKDETVRKIEPNIFEEAYRSYVGKNDLHALRLFRRSINEMLKTENGKTVIDEILENLKNIAFVGNEYLDLFLIKINKKIEDLEDIMNIDSLTILKFIDYSDIDNLFMAAGHFLEAAETSLLLRSKINFHLFYCRFLVCFMLIKRILDIKRISGADDLLKVHIEGINKIESLLADYYRLQEVSEINMTSEEMFYTLENLKSVLITKYEENDYVGVITSYFNIMGVIEAFERSFLENT